MSLMFAFSIIVCLAVFSIWVVGVIAAEVDNLALSVFLNLLNWLLFVLSAALVMHLLY